MTILSTEIRLSNIDYEQNTLYLTVNGYSVTAICSTQDDPTMYENIKQVLIGSLSGRIQDPSTKLDNTQK